MGAVEFYLLFLITTLLFILTIFRKSILPSVFTIVLSIFLAYYTVITYKTEVETYLFGGISLMYLLSSLLVFWIEAWRISGGANE